jgi:glycosyltransferase involved in cell wall biosynthesis
LKVLHVLAGIGKQYGGPAYAVIEMCRAASSADPGISLTIASTTQGLDDAWLAHVRERAGPGTTVVTHRAFGSGAFVFSPGLASWLWRHASDYDVITVHGLLNPISTSAARIARARDVPYVIRPFGTLSEYTFSYRRRGLKRLWLALADRATVQKAAAVHFTADQEQRKAAKLGLRFQGVVIPLPSLTPPSRPASPPLDPPVVLFLSRLHPKKGLSLLLPAFVRVLERFPNARLRIAGRGDPAYEAELRADVLRLGLSHAVEFAGFAEGPVKRRFYEEATVFVLPSYDENFAVVVMEAMCAYRPVVLSREVDIWEAVVHAGAGLAVDLEPVAIAAAIVKLLDDPKAAAQLGEEGARLVSEQYSPARVGKLLIELYQRIAQA